MPLIVVSPRRTVLVLVVPQLELRLHRNNNLCSSPLPANSSSRVCRFNRLRFRRRCRCCRRSNSLLSPHKLRLRSRLQLMPGINPISLEVSVTAIHRCLNLRTCRLHLTRLRPSNYLTDKHRTSTSPQRCTLPTPTLRLRNHKVHLSPESQVCLTPKRSISVYLVRGAKAHLKWLLLFRHRCLHLSSSNSKRDSRISRLRCYSSSLLN